MKNKKDEQLIEPTFMTEEDFSWKDMVLAIFILAFMIILMMFASWIFDMMPVK